MREFSTIFWTSFPAPARHGRFEKRAELHGKLPSRNGCSQPGKSRFDAGADDFHDTTTAFTSDGRAWFCGCRHRNAFEYQLHQPHPFAVGVQKAEVAGPAVTLGQDVLQDQPEKFSAADGAAFHLFGFAVLIAEFYLTVFAGEYVLFLNHAPVQVTPQINQRGLSAADLGAIDDPFLGVPR